MLKHINDEPPFCGTLYVWKVSTHLLLLQCIVDPNTTRLVRRGTNDNSAYQGQGHA